MLKTRVMLVVAASLGLSLGGCETLKVVDARISARLERSGFLKPPIVWQVKPAKTGTAVTLRSGPGTEHPMIRVLAVGETVTPLGITEGWRAVRMGGSETGFVRDRDLQPAGLGPQRFATP
jgi:hypothetical protein